MAQYRRLTGELARYFRGDYGQATDVVRNAIALVPGELSRKTLGNLVLPAVGAGCCRGSHCCSVPRPQWSAAWFGLMTLRS
jgi:hypothetical protein